MGGVFCRTVCCRAREDGDALDALTPEERQRRRPWADRAVEEYFDTQASCKDRNYVNFMLWMTFSGFPKVNPEETVIPFKSINSPFVKGLKLLDPSDSPETLKQVSEVLKGNKKVIVGSVRMGYGHHRIAYSALTWALELGGEPYLLDILSPDCVEAHVVRHMDHQYSKFSRIASNFGGIVDHLWGKMTLQGDMNAMRICMGLSEKIRGIISGFPREVPIISSHPIIGNMAVACGFKTVINLVFDNLPQYFVLVPGAINLLQSPSYFDKLLDMGCPASSLRVAGHWVSSDICLNTVKDCEARIARCKDPSIPRRFLIAVGGAGAQKSFLEELLQGLAEKLKQKKLRIYINCGDHVHIADAVVKKLSSLGLEYNEINTTAGVEELCKKEPLASHTEPADWAAITLLRFNNHFSAFQCTDLVIRIADVLVTKPSELAFFPIPKLHIRRVGAHEAHSAVRSEELGDGTVECREVPHALRKFEQLCQPQSPLFLMMNQFTIKAANANTYDGSKVACEYAFGLERAGSGSFWG